MTKIAGSGSGSISQRHGSADPDPNPHQNVMDPENWLQCGCHACCIIVCRADLSNDQQMNYLLACFQDWSDLFYCVQGGPVQRSADELPAGLVPGLVRPAAGGLCGRPRGVSVQQQARRQPPQRTAQRDGGLELQVRCRLGDSSVLYPSVPVPTYPAVKSWGSLTFLCGSGSGSADPNLWLMDPGDPKTSGSGSPTLL